MQNNRKCCHANSMSPKQKLEKELSAHDLAFDKLISEIEPYPFLGKAYDIPSLLESFKQKILEDNAGVSGESYTSQKLKNRLLSHYHTRISFLKQDPANTPELLIKNDIDLKDVINVALIYKEMLRDLKIFYDNNKGALIFDRSVTLFMLQPYFAVILMKLWGYPFSHLTVVISVKNAVKPSFQTASITFFIGPFALKLI